jgi:hypothetical protein
MLNVSEQIALLKDNGISFTGISEKDAANYLYDKTFLFKLKAFDKNFDKYQDAQDSRFGTYIDLDFAYLVELAELDRNLRFFVIHAALDIEHYLKVHLNKALMDSNVDAYKIVCDFFDYDAERKRQLIGKSLFNYAAASRLNEVSKALAQISDWLTGDSCNWTKCADEFDASQQVLGQIANGINLHHCENSITQLEASSYSHDVAQKYGKRGKMAYWNFLELATFGDIIAFYKYCFIELGGGTDATAKRIKPLLFPAKALRNAAAHNSNLLGGLRQKSKKPVGRIASLLKKEYGLDEELVNKTRRVPVVHDFGALLLTYDAIVASGSSKQRCAEKLKQLSENLVANVDMFAKQPEVYECLLCLSKMASAMCASFEK